MEPSPQQQCRCGAVVAPCLLSHHSSAAPLQSLPLQDPVTGWGEEASHHPTYSSVNGGEKGLTSSLLPLASNHLCLSLSLSLPPFLPVSLCLSLPLSVSVFLSLSLILCLLSVFLPPSLCPSLSLSPSFSVSITLPVSLPPSLCLSLPLFLCLCSPLHFHRSSLPKALPFPGHLPC